MLKELPTVVRVILDGSKIKPGRLTAAGRSEYAPSEAGDTPESQTEKQKDGNNPHSGPYGTI